jgi:transcriptional regulatory protein RtcR
LNEELERLRASWTTPNSTGGSLESPEELERLLGRERLESVDPFDRVQLAYVVRMCRESRSLSEAGRTLFRASRLGRKQPNDADRLSKYLARFGLRWADCVATAGGGTG